LGCVAQFLQPVAQELHQRLSLLLVLIDLGHLGEGERGFVGDVALGSQLGRQVIYDGLFLRVTDDALADEQQHVAPFKLLQQFFRNGHHPFLLPT